MIVSFREYNRIKMLIERIAKAKSALAQKTREREEKDATISDLRLKWNGALESEDAALRNCRELQAQVEQLGRQVAEIPENTFTLLEIKTAVEESLKGHSYAGEKYWSDRIIKALLASRARTK